MSRRYRLPAVYLHRDQYMHVTQRMGSGSKQVYIDTDKGTMNTDTTYHVEISVMHGTFSVWLDGTLAGTEDAAASNAAGSMDNQPIYVSNPWNTAATVEVSNFNYLDLDECTFPPTMSPTVAVD